ncbi:MAG: M48 family metallopeptidase [Saprospiraceae bacterium]|nr:M48 family metallopeptidase [Saprospiraceae bacterium]
MGLLNSLRKQIQKPPSRANYILEHRDFRVPVAVIHEARPNSRVSIGKAGAILRISSFLKASDQDEQIRKFRQWIIDQLDHHADRYERFCPKIYRHGQILEVGNRKYSIRFIYESDRKTVSGKLGADRSLVFKVPFGATDIQLGPVIEKLLSRIVGADFLPEVTARVHELNRQYFQKTITSVQLKYNHSNWGSCSSKGNINLSTRLLFAPAFVLDYVIIHELAHLIEMNHSDRFWKQVERVMPGYQKAEHWLKKHGNGMSY